MKNTLGSRTVRAVATTLAAAGLALTLAGCGTSASGTPDDAGAADVSSALDAGGSLLIWAWEPTLQPVVDAFVELHPNVDIQLANVGMTSDHYIALQNAIAAGSGVPDIAQVEYSALAQFTIIDALADLTQFGAGELQGTFSPGPWNAVTAAGGVFGMPMDSGPMALFYNHEVFAAHGIEVPTTWQEYLDAARALRAADPSIYIGADAYGVLAQSLIWQAGGQPFTVDGDAVGIDLVGDPGVAQYTEIWQQLIDEDLIAANMTWWTDEWFQALGNGTLATLTAGGWMPANFELSIPQGAGAWRAAPMPQFEAGATASAELGGSSLAVTSASTNQALAYAFLEFATVGDGVQLRLDEGAFPATLEHLNDEEFLSREFAYFGGQQVNRVFSESAANVVPGWQFLPFQVYANNIFPDTAGQAFIGATTLEQGFTTWQNRLQSFGEIQGFTMQ